MPLGTCYATMDDIEGNETFVCRRCGQKVLTVSAYVKRDRDQSAMGHVAGRLRLHAEGCFPEEFAKRLRLSSGEYAGGWGQAPEIKPVPEIPEEIDGARFRLIERNYDAALR